MNPRRRTYDDTVEQSLRRKLSREDVLALAGSGAKRGGGGYSAANCPAMKLAWHVEH
jgi:hypothetical protein